MLGAWILNRQESLVNKLVPCAKHLSRALEVWSSRLLPTVVGLNLWRLSWSGLLGFSRHISNMDMPNLQHCLLIKSLSPLMCVICVCPRAWNWSSQSMWWMHAKHAFITWTN